MAGIQSVGVKLIKTLVNGRKVITETAGNKTLTKVFDRYGNLLTDRTKTIEKAVVGNKKVITKNETRLVNTYSPVNYRPNESFAFKYKSERVYDKSGKLLGMRETENAPGRVWTMTGQNPLEHMPDTVHVTKSVLNKNKLFDTTPDVNSYIKDFQGGKIVNKFKTFFLGPDRHGYYGLTLGSRKPQYNYSHELRPNSYNLFRTGDDLFFNGYSRVRGVRYNNKGLPLPQSYHNCTVMDYNKLQNMSLKDMRNEWLKANSRYGKYNACYVDYNKNMDFLNLPYNLTNKK